MVTGGEEDVLDTAFGPIIELELDSLANEVGGIDDAASRDSYPIHPGA